MTKEQKKQTVSAITNDLVIRINEWLKENEISDFSSIDEMPLIYTLLLSLLKDNNIPIEYIKVLDLIIFKNYEDCAVCTSVLKKLKRQYKITDYKIYMEKVGDYWSLDYD